MTAVPCNSPDGSFWCFCGWLAGWLTCFWNTRTWQPNNAMERVAICNYNNENNNAGYVIPGRYRLTFTNIATNISPTLTWTLTNAMSCRAVTTGSTLHLTFCWHPLLFLWMAVYLSVDRLVGWMRAVGVFVQYMCHGGSTQYTFSLATNTHDGTVGANSVYQSTATVSGYATTALSHKWDDVSRTSNAGSRPLQSNLTKSWVG